MRSGARQLRRRPAFALVASLTLALGVGAPVARADAGEIAVRMALGASRTGVLALVFRQGMSLAAVGIVTGLAAAILASRVLESMLFGISRLDTVSYAGVVLVLTATSAAACWLPAWRAARLDPNAVLRAE